MLKYKNEYFNTEITLITVCRHDILENIFLVIDQDYLDICILILFVDYFWSNIIYILMCLREMITDIPFVPFGFL